MAAFDYQTDTAEAEMLPLLEWLNRTAADREAEPPRWSHGGGFRFVETRPDLVISGRYRGAFARTFSATALASEQRGPGSDGGDGTSFTSGDTFPVWWASSVYYFADSSGPVFSPISATYLDRYLPWRECTNESDPTTQPDGAPLAVSFPFQVKINRVWSILKGASISGESELPDPPGQLHWYTHAVDTDVAHPDLYAGTPSSPSVYTETLADPIYVDSYTGLYVSAQFGPLSFETLSADVTISIGCHLMGMALEVV